MWCWGLFYWFIGLEAKVIVSSFLFLTDIAVAILGFLTLSGIDFDALTDFVQNKKQGAIVVGIMLYSIYRILQVVNKINIDREYHEKRMDVLRKFEKHLENFEKNENIDGDTGGLED